jgi:hypothetical protein
MHNRYFVVSMTIEGEKIQAFSAITLNLPPIGEDYSQSIIENSRSKYAIARHQVEKFVGERYLGNPLQQTKPSAPIVPAEKPKIIATPAKLAHAIVRGALGTTSIELPKRRRRRRRRSSEPRSDYQATAAKTAAQDQPHELTSEHTINLQ